MRCSCRVGSWSVVRSDALCPLPLEHAEACVTAVERLGPGFYSASTVVLEVEDMSHSYTAFRRNVPCRSQTLTRSPHSDRSPTPKAERTARRASTGAVPSTLAAAAAAAAVSAPPLANGQAVFGAATHASRGGRLQEGGASPQQQMALPAMTPDMAAALQVLAP